uniref:F-box domain-containing protein n=1 Tax=Panagrellus redivivus TaxID=6233 RepID=A0A7E4VIC2_PANRE
MKKAVIGSRRRRKTSNPLSETSHIALPKELSIEFMQKALPLEDFDFDVLLSTMPIPSDPPDSLLQLRICVTKYPVLIKIKMLLQGRVVESSKTHHLASNNTTQYIDVDLTSELRKNGRFALGVCCEFQFPMQKQFVLQKVASTSADSTAETSVYRVWGCPVIGAQAFIIQ